MRSGPALAIALATVVLGAPPALAAADLRRSSQTEVVVDLRAKRQVIHGFGTSNRVWSDPHLSDSPKTVVPARARAAIMTSLYGKLGLTRVRNVLDNGNQRSPGDPLRFGGKLADDHIAFVKEAKRYGLQTFFPGPVYLENWMTAGDPGAYVDWAMAMLKRWRAKGLEPPLYAPLNEPLVAGDFPPQWMHDVVIQLGQRLRAAGFKTKLVIPDDENPTAAYRRAVAVLADPAARKYVGALAYHVYRWNRDDMVRMRQLATQHGLPVWMTEYSTKNYKDWRSSFEWAERMHVLLTDGGVNAVDYLWGFFGDWVATDTMLSIRFDNGVYRSFSPRPIYWLTGQYSRYVRPGFVRVSATPSTGSVLVSAYRGPGRAIVVATNPRGRTETVRISFTGERPKSAVARVRSSANERWRNLPPLTLRGGALTTTLPPESVTTFVLRR